MVINPMIEELLLKHHPHLKQKSAYPPGKQPIKPQRKQMLGETQELLNRPDSTGQTKLANKLVEGTATKEDLLVLSTHNITTQFVYNQNVSEQYWTYTPPDNYKKAHCFYDFAKVVVPALSRKNYLRYAQFLLKEEMKSPQEAFRNINIPTMFLLIEFELHIATLPRNQITVENIFSNIFLYLLNEVILPALNSKSTIMTYERKCKYVKDNLIKKISDRLQSLIELPPHSDVLISRMVSTSSYPEPNFDDPINQRPISISQELADILNTPLNLNPPQRCAENKGGATKSSAMEMALLPPSVVPDKQPSYQIDRVVTPVVTPANIPIAIPVSHSTEKKITGAKAASPEPTLTTASAGSSILFPTRVNGPAPVATVQILTQAPIIAAPPPPSLLDWLSFSLFSSDRATPTETAITISQPEPKHAASQIENNERLNNSLSKSALGPLSRFYGSKEIDYAVNGAEYAKLPWLKSQECDLSACTNYQLTSQLIFNFNAVVDLLDNDAIRNCRAFDLLIKAAILFHNNLINKYEKIDSSIIQLARAMIVSLEKMEKYLPAQAPEINKFPPPPPQPFKRSKSAPLENGNNDSHGTSDASQAKLDSAADANRAAEDLEKPQNGLRLSQ